MNHTNISKSGLDIVKWFNAKFSCPYTDGQWGNRVNDHAALATIMTDEKYHIQSGLELGTWCGYTTLLMWLMPNMRTVSTMDIAGQSKSYHHHYHTAQEKSFYGHYVANTPVERIVGSTGIISAVIGKWDFIFIDADHSYEWVKQDTIWAIACKPKVIAWHDYRNGNPGVDKWLDEFSTARDLTQIDNSAVVYMEV